MHSVYDIAEITDSDPNLEDLPDCNGWDLWALQVPSQQTSYPLLHWQPIIRYVLGQSKMPSSQHAGPCRHCHEQWYGIAWSQSWVFFCHVDISHQFLTSLQMKLHARCAIQSGDDKVAARMLQLASWSYSWMIQNCSLLLIIILWHGSAAASTIPFTGLFLES